MALINCPECGKEISDKCERCIHCGYPLINTICDINGIVYDFKDELPIALLESVDDYMPAIGNIRRKTSLSLTDACDLVDIMKEKKSVPTSFTPQFPLEDNKKINNDQIAKTIKCPYCNSTNTKRISTVSKAGSVALWGVFGLGKATKQWHCNSCNSDF